MYILYHKYITNELSKNLRILNHDLEIFLRLQILNERGQFIKTAIRIA